MKKPAAAGSLRMEHLSVHFVHEGESFAAVNNVDLALPPGAVTCLVGESGCGKSLTARAVLRLTPEKSAISGRIFLGDTDILALSEIELRRFRGRRAAMVFQEPMTSLNPVLTVGEQAAEPLRLHFGMTRAQARQETEDLFAEVGIPAPRSRYDDYPHQLSGGMRQRVMIAMALACRPELLLADEPTTALDATVQGQILRLFADQMRERGMTVLFITHDLGVVAQIADVVGVMYAGRLVEDAPAGEFFAAPRHPYSRGLMRSAPGRQSMRLKRLPAIDGVVPALWDIPLGCPFQPRCAEALPRCSEAMPPPFAAGSGRTACWRAEPSFFLR